MEKQQARELLLQAERGRKKWLKPKILELGLVPGQGQLKILNQLYQVDHISQKDLAESCQVDVTTMSRSLDKLEEAGFLTRERNAECRRSFFICLTQKGREEAAMAHSLLSSIDEIIWRGIGKEEMEAFCATLEKICENLKQEGE